MGYKLFAKRLLDVAVSAIVLIALSPLFLILSVAVKIDGPGPVFVAKLRRTYANRTISVLTFRCDNLNHQPSWFGGLMMRTGLYHLPTFINVLRGDMSIVGPRCYSETGLISADAKRCLAVLANSPLRPGMLNCSDVSDSKSCHQRIHDDLFYVMNWSLLFDAKIVLRQLCSRASYYQDETP